MSLRYDIVDVFTERPYAGNPLAVVHGGTDLTSAQMQAIAAEFRLSETVFPLPPTEGGADYRLRIFTPVRELPFAGHPSVGAAWVLARDRVIGTGEVVQECGAGLLPITVDEHGARVTGGRAELGRDLHGPALAAALGLSVDDLDPAMPAGVAAAGVPFGFLPVRPEAVARVVPEPAELLAASADLVGVTVFAFDRTAWRVHLRMFAPAVGVAEDPATGSAALALSVFLAGRGQLADGQTGFVVDQGVELGRPSRLGVLVEVVAGVAVRTSVYGAVAAVARGELIALPSSER
jgi:trans-2,3-dihydro-3-hydroxyanthranilate isomerase